MFVDKVKIRIKAGDGGNGAVAFHREKYVASGGPDGGDGGRGGDILFQGDSNLSTLLDFRYKKRYAAQNGANGQGGRRSGKSAPPLTIKVPLGTVVRDAESGAVMADLSDDQPVVVAKGGKGGWGNAHFATPTRQTPRFSKPGLPGESYEVLLELKLLADVGLVGFPNVGKSTLISMVSAAKPEIANYPFTTLTPVLGVVQVREDKSFVMADIPGLIEGASDGIGLGHEFLRHVERCRLILHVVDVSALEGRDPVEDFHTINRELHRFNPELAGRPQIIAANKCDAASPEQIDAFARFVQEQNLPFFPVSAAANQGLLPLVQHIAAQLDALPPVKRFAVDFVPATVKERLDRSVFTVAKDEDGVFVVNAPWLTSAFAMVDPDDMDALEYLQRVLQQSGVMSRLEKMGIQQGDTVRILDVEFDYID